MLHLLAVDLTETAYNTIWGLSDTWSAIVMLLISVACGVALGSERAVREKEAGIRTHVILILGATLFTIISCSFADDGARIMAQIVTGVGFIGAGIIMFRGESLHGLTTAAGIWTTAGIGMAIGNGMIVVGLVATALVLLCQIVLHAGVASRRKFYRYIRIGFVYDDKMIAFLKQTFEVENFGRLKFRQEGGKMIADAIARTCTDCAADRLASIMIDNPNVLSLERLDINRY